MEIKLNCSKFLIKINKKEVIKNLFDFNLGSVLTEVVGLESNIESKAFLLIFNTSRETNMQLAKAYGREQLNNQYNLVSVTKNLESEYKEFLELNVALSEDFFFNVIRFDNQYLIKSFNLFSKFCDAIGIVLPEDIRLNYYVDFRENLKIEFHNNKERYKELVDFFDNPINSQNDKFTLILNKYYEFKKFYTNPLQQNEDSKETLQDLYVEPFFSIHKNNLLKLKKNDENKDFHLYSEGNIHDFFNTYFLKGIHHKNLKNDYDMVFVLGQPGQGKTSFCYRLIYDYIEKYSDLPPVPIIFLKIRDLIAKDFINNPFDTISNYYNYINFKGDELIIVLDGLDEAYMSGGISNEDLRNLYERLKKRSNKKIKIILTSRFNFLNINDSCLDNTLVLHLNELTDKQINEYCIKFKSFYPKNSLVKNIKTILVNEKYKHVKELLKQAVLIYFIAISDIKIDKKDSKSKIYDKIFDSLAQRSWDAEGQLDYINRKLKDNPELYKSYLREYIRSIAFEIYHSPKLYITVNKLIELEATKLFIKRCFNEDLQESSDKIKEISKYLLISFYFQQSNKDNSDTALEFFHNSLWEFLTAEYLWEKNKKLLLRENDFKEFEYVSKEEYFDFLSDSIGNKKINEFSVAKNLIEIIENEDINKKKDVFNQSINIFYELSSDNFLFKYNRKNCLLSAFDKATEIFTLFWILIHESNVENVNLNLNALILDFLFNKADMRFKKEIKNIHSIDDLLGDRRVLYEFKILNSSFINGFYAYNVFDSNFQDVVFSQFYSNRSLFEDNIFQTVSFIDCSFYDNLFINNEFVNTKMINVRIKDLEWYNCFLNKNKFDKYFLDHHYVEKIKEINHRGEENENFYITFKNENN